MTWQILGQWFAVISTFILVFVAVMMAGDWWVMRAKS